MNMRSLLTLLIAAFVLTSLGAEARAQHAKPAASRKQTKKRRARVRAHEEAPRSLATDEDDEMVLAPQQIPKSRAT